MDPIIWKQLASIKLPCLSVQLTFKYVMEFCRMKLVLRTIVFCNFFVFLGILSYLKSKNQVYVCTRMDEAQYYHKEINQ